MARLIILDRDGVINQDSEAFIKSPEEWIPIAGSLEAIARFKQADYRVVVATNQSGIGRGLFDLDTLHQIHAKMAQMLASAGANIDAIFFCPHAPEERCDCRKPKAGLFHDIATRFNLDLTGVAAVGDSLRDLQAARVVAATPILVRTGKGQKTEARGQELEGVAIFDNLAAVADSLLSH